jgi:hypothetical protein
VLGGIISVVNSALGNAGRKPMGFLSGPGAEAASAFPILVVVAFCMVVSCMARRSLNSLCRRFSTRAATRSSIPTLPPSTT